MDNPSASRPALWRRGWQRIRTVARYGLPFASGVAAALVALWLYAVLVPAPHVITQSDVNNTIAQVLASATAPPAYSESVYQIIQPSLVLVQTKSPGANGTIENGLGSGVIVDDMGDILTSLHVV